MLLDLIDVFATTALTGNPLAVVRGGDALTGESMLALTRWLGFSETTFLLPPTHPDADYRVRIFYPAGELPFAGHPTLGSCHAWLAGGGRPRTPGLVQQECGVGLVPVRIDPERLAFQAPKLRNDGPLTPEERARAISFAGVDPATVVAARHADNGPRWQLLHLRSATDVLAARPQAQAPAQTEIGLVGPHAPGADSVICWEARAFFAAPGGIFREDPVTGSFNAGVAAYLFGAGLARGSYIARQGRCTGADGRVVAEERDGIWIGGKVTTVSSGGTLTPG